MWFVAYATMERDTACCNSVRFDLRRFAAVPFAATDRSGVAVCGSNRRKLDPQPGRSYVKRSAPGPRDSFCVC